MEHPVYAVLIVGGSEDLRDNEFAPAGDDDRVITEIGVFEKDTRVLLVDAYGILDGNCSTGFVRKVGIQIMNSTLAIASQAMNLLAHVF